MSILMSTRKDSKGYSGCGESLGQALEMLLAPDRCCAKMRKPFLNRKTGTGMSLGPPKKLVVSISLSAAGLAEVNKSDHGPAKALEPGTCRVHPEDDL